jgi:hypothetical protein
MPSIRLTHTVRQIALGPHRTRIRTRRPTPIIPAAFARTLGCTFALMRCQIAKVVRPQVRTIRGSAALGLVTRLLAGQKLFIAAAFAYLDAAAFFTARIHPVGKTPVSALDVIFSHTHPHPRCRQSAQGSLSGPEKTRKSVVPRPIPYASSQTYCVHRPCPPPSTSPTNPSWLQFCSIHPSIPQYLSVSQRVVFQRPASILGAARGSNHEQGTQQTANYPHSSFSPSALGVADYLALFTPIHTQGG